MILQIWLSWTWTWTWIHSDKLLDPDPHKINADPQPWTHNC